jgi:hypothetical protein
VKHYPVIGEFDEHEYEVDPIALEDEDMEQFDEEEPPEEDTFKDEPTPNEACYIDVEPIEPNALVPLNDSIARKKALSYKE